jgi:putative endonuclease
LRRHLSNHRGFTAAASDWLLVYYETFDDIAAARKRELQIKKWKSAKKIAELIQNQTIKTYNHIDNPC